MSQHSSNLDNPINWSWRLGRIAGITIRVHLLFIVGAAVVIGLSLRDAERSVGLDHVSDSLVVLALLFLIVLLHEFGHCYGARASGGEADEILLWPLGGLASVRPPDTPRGHFNTTIAGPLVNVALCILTGVVLTLRHGGIGAIPWNPLRGFEPLDYMVDPTDVLQKWLRVMFGLNYIILLFNLLPMYPLDGGRLLHAVLWARGNRHRATMTATFVGMIGAIALGLAGLMLGGTLMIAIAIFGYLTCYYDRRMARINMLEDGGEFGYDFSQGFTSLEREHEAKPRKPGWWAQRRAARIERRVQRAAEDEARHRRHVDEILLKVHREGMPALTPDERRVLEKETERQRSEES